MKTINKTNKKTPHNNISEFDSTSFWIFGNTYDYCDVMVKDALSYKNVFYSNSKLPIKNKILRFFYKVHHSKFANCLFPLPFKSKWYKKIIGYKKIQNYSRKVFIFFDSNPMVYNRQFLKFLREKINDSMLVLYFSNPMKLRTFCDIDYFKHYFDKIYTCDEDDSKKYSFGFQPDFYSCYRKHNETDNLRYDVFFVGNAKGRDNLILKLYNFFVSKNLTCKFVVVNSKLQLPSEIDTNPISYSDVLKYIKESRCILEIANEGTKSTTLRYNEAIVYNKILITNNSFYKTLPYYNPSSMFIVDYDGDLHGVSINDDYVDYKYKGDFSIINFLYKIIK